MSAPDPRRDDRVRELVEEALDAGISPEEVCRDRPDLLPDVRERWERVRDVAARVDALFPLDGSSSGPGTATEPRGEFPAVDGYEFESVLGYGGMGVVYRARQLKLNRTVALKMMLAGAFAGPRDRARFVREAAAAARLASPNIVQVFDVGEAYGRPYFTMEYVVGGTLAAKYAGAPQPPRAAAALVAALARAVEVAHAGGIVHRDLKPSNVLLTADGTPKIADFGIARPLDAEVPLTLSGDRVGTPEYMAPEQSVGRAGAGKPPVDVYSLGAILYEALTGRPPFRAASAAETQRQALSDDPVPPSRLAPRTPRDLETICLACLHKDPRRRYASAAALADDLGRFLADEPVAARRPRPLERLVRFARRRPGVVAWSAALAVVAAFGGVALARELQLDARRRAVAAKWSERFETVARLESEGRFGEARLILDGGAAEGDDELRAKLAVATADLDLVERLDGVRLNRGAFVPGGGIDYAESDRAYAAAFRAAGIPATDDDPEPAARRIAASPVRAAIVAALDDWAACAEAATRARILATARRADPDPWRDSVRDQSRWADVAFIEGLGAAADVRRQPVTIMAALGTRWRRLGGDPTAFLLRVQRVHPHDFWVNFELGHLLSVSDVATAAGYLRAALAVRPDAPAAHYNLGLLLENLRDGEGARFHFARTIAADARHTFALERLGYSYLRDGRAAEALPPLTAALALAPENAATRGALDLARILAGRGTETADAWGRRLADEPASHEAWDGYAELCLFVGRTEAYEDARKRLLARFGDATDPHVCERAGRACLLAPGSPEQRRAAAAMIERALADTDRAEPWARGYFLFARGLAQYRDGDARAAVATLRACGDEILPPAVKLVRAMAEARCGLAAEGRRRAALAAVSFDWRPSAAFSKEAWIYHALRREAEAEFSAADADADRDGRYARLLAVGAHAAAERSVSVARAYLGALDGSEDDDRDDPFGRMRFAAARWAALAGLGVGADAAELSPAEKRTWRDRARGWLEEAIDRELSRDDAVAPAARAAYFESWRSERDFAGVRGDLPLSRLPADEREAWRELWRRVGPAAGAVPGAAPR